MSKAAALLQLCSEDIKLGDLNRIEVLLDKLFGTLGIDVEFTRHFRDRMNDPRNIIPITLDELAKLYADVFRKFGKVIKNLPDGAEAVMKDISSDVNIPFVLNFDKARGVIDMVAKTIMRKKNFKTRTRQFKVK